MDSSIVTQALGGLQGPFATINGVELTAGSAQLVIDAIVSMTDKSLKAKRGDLGYRGLDASSVRSKLLAAVRTNAPLPTVLVDSLRQRLPACRVLDLFSESFIDGVERIWPNIFGQHAAGLALILDQRPKLHAIGKATLHARRDEFAMDIHEARQTLLREIQGAFLGHATIFAEFPGAPLNKVSPEEEADHTPTATASLRNVAGQIAEEIASHKVQVDNLKRQLQEQEVAFKERLTSKEAEMAGQLEDEQRRSQRIPALEAQVKAGKEREQQLSGMLIQKEKLFEGEVKRRVDAELSKAVRPWLSEARMLENMSATRTDLELEEKVRTLLKMQEALDLNHGSRSRLKHRLGQFSSYAEKIRAVLEDSLAPHPELEPLLRRLEVEMRHLRLLLNIHDSASPHLAKLGEAISCAISEEVLTDLERSIDVLTDKGVLSNRESSGLYRRLHVAYDKLALKSQEPSNKPRRRSGWELGNVLARNQPATVYLDAHNVLLQTVDCYEAYFEIGRITPQAEEALVQDVIKLAQNRPAVLFRVVIDATKAGEENRTSNVVVERTGGVGSDRADGAIILHASRSGHRNDWFVVTEDKSLRAQATTLGGIFAPVPVWQLMLEGFGVRQDLEESVVDSVSPLEK